MNSKTILATIAIVSALALVIAPALVGSASAKISPPSCTNPAGKTPGGQQPTCQGEGLTQSPATNPAGKAPPGQQP